MGRPSLYTKEIAEKILAGLAEGRSLNSICNSDPSFPAASTFRSWVIDDLDGISARSTRAYSIGHDAIADDCLDISDDEPDVQRARVRVDTRLRLLGKWAPKRYGDKLEVDQNTKLEAGDTLTELMIRLRTGSK